MMRFRHFPILAAVSLILNLATLPSADAGLFKRRVAPAQACPNGQCARPAAQAAVQPVYRATTQTTTTTTTTVATTDYAWFIGWLNQTRAAYGLAAVAYDANLASWAAANSAEQSRRGLGHWVKGPARRQNSAMGGAASIGSMWLASPAHRAALLDPSIRYVGLAVYGSYWTFNAR